MFNPLYHERKYMETYELALKELNAIQVIKEWAKLKKQSDELKKEFEKLDKPFREQLKKIFMEYGVESLENDDVKITTREGSESTKWDDEKLKAYMYKHDLNPDDFKTTVWKEATIVVKAK